MFWLFYKINYKIISETNSRHFSTCNNCTFIYFFLGPTCFFFIIPLAFLFLRSLISLCHYSSFVLISHSLNQLFGFSFLIFHSFFNIIFGGLLFRLKEDKIKIETAPLSLILSVDSRRSKL